MVPNDPNCLSWWFPRLEGAGLPVPHTILLEAPDLSGVCEGEKPPGWDEFLSRLQQAGERVGYPCFLRTGHTSGKFGWGRTCYVQDPRRFADHVCALVEFSELACILGLPTWVWAVREILPTQPLLVSDLGMPIVREFRAFVVRENGAVRCRCIHPYWPLGALRQQCDEAGAITLQAAYERLSALQDGERDTLEALAVRAGEAMGQRNWSVDLLATERGWYVTDLAIAEDSYHWEGCSNNQGGG